MKYILDNLNWILPLLITSVITPVATYVVGRSKGFKKEVEDRLNKNDRQTYLVMSASVSILRRELKNTAALLIGQDYASIEDKDLFEADYQQYEDMIDELGLENGLIEHLRDSVLALPTNGKGDN